MHGRITRSMSKVKRLLDSFKPKNYQLELTISQDAEVFSGRVTITGELTKEQNYIKFHSKGLEITKAEIDNQEAKIKLNPKDDELSLALSQKIPAGKHIVYVEYKGHASEHMHGIYPGYYSDGKSKKSIISTQFESHYAREAFVCIDEPAAKATFDITLITDSGNQVLSNTAIKKQTTDKHVVTTTFERTPIMSTYLVAFAVGELKSQSTKTKNDTLVRVWATAKNSKQTEFALDVAKRSLEFFEDYFDIPYPLSKCDLVAVPSFDAAAMENWGLITFRESAILYDPNESSKADQEWIAKVVVHEVAHQWFGNLVTMDWWDDLWLNEGFATWMESYATDQLFKKWGLLKKFVNGRYSSAMKLDSLSNSHPIVVKINHPDEITSAFDVISYGKGASLIRMLHSYLGEDDFRKGLGKYLRDFAYKNAVTSDLWTSLEAVSGKPVGSLMESWTTQTGYPLVSAQVSKDNIKLSQSVFKFINPTSGDGSQATVWPIDVDITNSDKSVYFDTQEKNWLVSTDSTVKLNQGQNGFYRVAYDEKHLKTLALELFSGSFDEVDRWGVLSDTFQLVQSGQYSSTQGFELLQNAASEESLIVWGSIFDFIASIRKIMPTDEIREALRPFCLELAALQLKRLGWEQKTSDSQYDKLLRPAILGYSSFGGSTRVRQRARSEFDKADSPSDIFADYRPLIYSIVAKENKQEDFDKLLRFYHDNHSDQEETNLLSGLSAFKDPKIISNYLGLIKEPHVKLQNIFYWVGYSMANSHASQQTWEWIKDNWQWLDERLGSSKGTKYFAEFPARSFSTKQQLADYKKFFSSVETKGWQRSVDQGIETITWQIAWRDRDEQKILDYLKSTS